MASCVGTGVRRVDNGWNNICKFWLHLTRMHMHTLQLYGEIGACSLPPEFVERVLFRLNNRAILIDFMIPHRKASSTPYDTSLKITTDALWHQNLIFWAESEVLG